MIQGNKAAGYGSTIDEKGRRIEHEYRQCSHCQFTWIYKPGSGRKVGFCYYCNGIMCARCLQITWLKGDNRCVPFYDGANENSSKYILDENLGIYIRK